MERGPLIGYVLGAMVIVGATALAVVLSIRTEAEASPSPELRGEKARACGHTHTREWDRFELSPSGDALTVFYYDSGSIRPCGVTYGDGALEVFTEAPRTYTLDLAPHCIRMQLPPGAPQPLVLRDPKDGSVHTFDSTLFSWFSREPCMHVDASG